MTVDELVVHGAGHVGQVEAPLLVGQAGVEDDLEEQVAQLLLQVRRRGCTLTLTVTVTVTVTLTVTALQCRQRVQCLVALLDQVRHQ